MTRELKRDFFPGFSANAEKLLSNYSWPGNVRELKNVIERSIYKSIADQVVDSIQFDPFDSKYRIDAETTFSSTNEEPVNEPNLDPQANHSDTFAQHTNVMGSLEFPIDLKQTIADTEIELIKKSLESAQYNQKKCAELLGLTYHQLRGYLKKYQLL